MMHRAKQVNPLCLKLYRFASSMDAYLAPRRKNGEYAENLHAAIANLRRRQDKRRICGDLAWNALRYFCGERITYHFCRNRNTCLTEECLDDKLYHFTLLSRVESIRKHGLLAVRRYVFLTDDPCTYCEEYRLWKSYMLRKAEPYTTICIDAKRLRQVQKLYRTMRPHEIVTGSIPPQYIRFDESE